VTRRVVLTSDKAKTEGGDRGRVEFGSGLWFEGRIADGVLWLYDRLCPRDFALTSVDGGDWSLDDHEPVFYVVRP
jgi:hypothetical protein